MPTETKIDLHAFICAVAAGEWPLPTSEDTETKRECYEAMRELLGLSIGGILGATATAIKNLSEFQERVIEDVLVLAEDDEAGSARPLRP